VCLVSLAVLMTGDLRRDRSGTRQWPLMAEHGSQVQASASFGGGQVTIASWSVPARVVHGSGGEVEAARFFGPTDLQSAQP
jgi:hypothetical protein